MTTIFGALVGDWERHHGQQQPHPETTTTEEHMSRLADAKAALDTAVGKVASLAASPLVDQLVEERLGALLVPTDVQLVIGLVRTLESARKAALPALEALPGPPTAG